MSKEGGGRWIAKLEVRSGCKGRYTTEGSLVLGRNENLDELHLWLL